NFPEGYWLNSDPRSVSMTASDTQQVYSLDLTLTHTTDYSFQNLYVKTRTLFPSGKEITSVTSLEMTGDDASWTVDCKGRTCSLVIPLQQRFTFPEVGTYKWIIEPYMRQDTIKEIQSISILCKKVEP